mmetsp:Transcript_21148/g.63553  ORF Transcript_21148/g.63553 Transcript_21148/m.63553 type:complete len:341 (+) Transcript_21148:686-1708(+)
MRGTTCRPHLSIRRGSRTWSIGCWRGTPRTARAHRSSWTCSRTLATVGACPCRGRWSRSWGSSAVCTATSRPRPSAAAGSPRRRSGSPPERSSTTSTPSRGTSAATAPRRARLPALAASGQRQTWPRGMRPVSGPRSRCRSRAARGPRSTPSGPSRRTSPSALRHRVGLRRRRLPAGAPAHSSAVRPPGGGTPPAARPQARPPRPGSARPHRLWAPALRRLAMAATPGRRRWHSAAAPVRAASRPRRTGVQSQGIPLPSARIAPATASRWGQRVAAAPLAAAAGARATLALPQTGGPRCRCSHRRDRTRRTAAESSGRWPLRRPRTSHGIPSRGTCSGPA